VKKVISVDYGDLEDFINDHYGIYWDIVANMEWNNDTSYTLNIKKEEMRDWDLKMLSLIKSGKQEGRLSIILTDLANNGIIEEGEYLINVCW
jgi:hypothetical protein